MPLHIIEPLYYMRLIRFCELGFDNFARCKNVGAGSCFGFLDSLSSRIDFIIHALSIALHLASHYVAVHISNLRRIREKSCGKGTTAS